jgi:hypothetical protein
MYVCVTNAGACEACWRLFSFPLQKKSHTIVRLALHLDGKQSIYFSDNKSMTEETIQKYAQTTLTAYFKANAERPAARQISYFEFPEHFTYNKKNKSWTKRKKHFNTIGRVYTAAPNQGERYYLRLILHHVKGATSYENLRTLPEGKVCATFKEACIEYGLLTDDSEWKNAMLEATLTATPTQMRELFVTILVFAEPVEPRQLYEDHKESMAEDYLYKKRQSLENANYPLDDQCIDCLLYDVRARLHRFSKTLGDYNLPQPTYPPSEPEGEARLIREERYDMKEQQEIMERHQEQFNHGQKAAYTRITQALTKDAPLAVFLDGPGQLSNTRTPVRTT